MLDIINKKVDPDRIARLKKLIKIDAPGVTDDVAEFLFKRQSHMFDVEYLRYLAGIKLTEADVDECIKGAVDCHAHGGSEPFERLLLEDEIGISYTRMGMKAVVIKTHYTPSASRNAIAQKYVNKWAEENGFEPCQLIGGICLNYSVGGINPAAVKRCLGFPNFRYVWMPSTESYWNMDITHGRPGEGIRYRDEHGKLLPETKEVLRIAADNDLVLSTGHYPYEDTKVLVEEAVKVGVKRIELCHVNTMHAKCTIEEMKDLLKHDGTFICLCAIHVLGIFPDIEGFAYGIDVLREVGTERVVFGTDAGQIQNPPHEVSVRWFTKVLFSQAFSKQDIKRVMGENAVKFIGIK